MKKVIKKLDNKGFTLVELIIVIAIIAVLAAVVAPQYIKYVESSREGTDRNTMTEIAHAAEVGAVTAGDGKVVVTTTGALAYTSTDDLTKEVEKTVAPNSYTFVSKKYIDKASVEITVTNGVSSWTDPAAPVA